MLGVLAETTPDLVILDVDMPQLNGIELCRVMRNDPRWAAVSGALSHRNQSSRPS